MEAERPLSAAFLAALSEPARHTASADGALESRLAALDAAARGGWPEIDLSAEQFVRYLGERVADAGDLSTVRAGDLYLACGCAAGDARALAAFEARVMPEVDPALARMNLPRERLDDVKQTLRRALFVPEGAGPARIAGYDGRGDLRAWLRVSAVRAALKLLRKERREVPLTDDQLVELPTPDEDAELQYLKRTYRAAFKAAFLEALASLPARDQNLLRQQYLDGLTIDQIGALYRVHRATAARWVERAREQMLAGTRLSLMKTVQVSRGECDSILRLVRGHLDMTFGSLLRNRL